MKARSSLVIVSAGFAIRRFGSTAVIGRSIEIDGRSSSIVGVMPPGFHFPNADTEVWEPYTRFLPYRPDKRDADYLCVLGRLKPGASIADARSDMAAIGQRLEHAHPNMPAGFGGFGVNVVPLYEHVYGRNTRPSLWLIVAGAFCILLIAVTNVANLLLAKITTRDREFAIRVALGASQPQLVRQLLFEIGSLAGIGIAIGLALAKAGLRILIHAFAARLPRLDHASLDWQVLLFGSALTLSTCLVSAWPPIRQLRRDRLAIRTRKRASTPMKHIFAVAQVALATALLGAAGLLLRSYLIVERSPLGYNPEHLLVFDIFARQSHPRSQAEANAYSARIAAECREALRSMPGVLGVANAGDLFLKRNPDWQIYLEGRESKPDGSTLADDIVTASFFRVMGVPLLSGRLFTPEEERDPARRVVVINEAMARKYWPGTNPVGKRFATTPPDAKQIWRTVIGVVGNIQITNREAGAMAEMYWAIADYPDLKFIVRTASEPSRMLATIRREIQSVDAGAVLHNPMTVEAQLDRWMAPRRMNTSIVELFSALATLLAGIGTFSLLHYGTALRVHEFGIRFALGATPARVVSMVVRDGVTLAVVGAVAGALGSILAAEMFSTLLFGVAPWDPAVFAASIAGAVVLAALASLIPAIRSALVNPIEALRSQ